MTDLLIPSDSEDITPEWLDQCFRRSGVIAGNNAVESITLSESIKNKGFISQVLRLNVTYLSPIDKAPVSVVVKLSSKDPEMREMGREKKFYEREVMFYQNVAPLPSINTAHCYYGAIDRESGKHVLILEDLSHARNGSRRAGCSFADAALAIRCMAKFHAAWWDNPKLDNLGWLPKFTDIYALEPVPRTFRTAWPNFLRKTSHLLPKAFLEEGERFANQMVSLTEQLFCGSRHKTLVHFDYQLDNIFFLSSQEESALVVIDWQLLTFGCGSVDVAYFLGQNLKATERKVFESDLLQLYYQVLIENGVRDYSFVQLRQDYKSALFFHLFGLVFTIGGDTFSPKQEALLLEKVLPRTISAILDSAALDSAVLDIT